MDIILSLHIVISILVKLQSNQNMNPSIPNWNFGDIRILVILHRWSRILFIMIELQQIEKGMATEQN